MKKVLLFLLSSVCHFIAVKGQTSLVLTSQRPPALDVSRYRQVAIGNIVGPLNTKTEVTLDLTDALSSRLFNAQTLELVDKATLDKLLGEQKYNDLQMIDEKTTQELNKKLSNALLITGRLQSTNLEQKLIYTDQALVVNGCNRTYYYQVKGNVSLQLKILDLKTGKLIYNDVVNRPVDKRTKEECTIPGKLDVGEITRQATKDLSEDIASLIVPYEVKTLLEFNNPGLFKSPFPKLRDALALIQQSNFEAGLALLKGYTEDKSLKSKFQAPALYNYGLGLLYAGQYSLARQTLTQSASFNSSYATQVNQLMQLIDKQEQAAQKMARLTEERQKMEQEEASAKNKESEKQVTRSAAAPKPSPKPKARG